MDVIGLTTEMEPIGEEVQKRRKVDHTLARFSAVHDELAEEERKRKAKRKIRPWSGTDDELEAGLTSAALPILTPTEIETEPEPQEDEAESEGKPRRTLTGRGKRSALAGKIIALVVAIGVFAATGVAWGLKNWFDDKIPQVDALDRNSADIKNAAGQLGDENFLLVGSDTRAGATDEEGVGDEGGTPGARSDTVMIAHVPKDRKRVVIVSFPRDLEVKRPACETWDAKTGKYGTEKVGSAEHVKLNSIYAAGGPKCVTKVVQQVSGIAINHFVGIDFQGFKGMVDAMHGVEVCVERPLKDTVLGMVVPEPGQAVTLSGDQALNFVRARHVVGDPTSDYGRITRQQRFLSALLRKAMSGQVLLDPSKMSAFVNAFAGSTFGDNLGVEQMATLGTSLQGLDAGRVTFITVPTVGEANDRGNEVLKEADTRSLFGAIIDDKPLPGETPEAGGAPPGEPAAPVDPHTVKIQVLNGGNKTAGIATKTADKLEEHGYQIVRTDNAPQNVEHTVVRYSKERWEAAKAVAAAVPGSQLQEDPSMSAAIWVVIGPEYTGQGGGGGGTTQAPTDEVPDHLSTVNGADVACA